MTDSKKQSQKFDFQIPKVVTWGMIQGLHDKMGGQVEPVLYALICDRQNPLRTTVDKNLKDGTQSAIVVLVPLLIAQFALAPAVAALVAGFAVKVIADKGQNKLCEELTARRAKREAEAKKVGAKQKVQGKSGGVTVKKKAAAKVKRATKKGK